MLYNDMRRYSESGDDITYGFFIYHWHKRSDETQRQEVEECGTLKPSESSICTYKTCGQSQHQICSTDTDSVQLLWLWLQQLQS